MSVKPSDEAVKRLVAVLEEAGDGPLEMSAPTLCLICSHAAGMIRQMRPDLAFYRIDKGNTGG